MLVRRYFASGIHNVTKRRRTIELPAVSVEHARKYAVKQGLCEPIEIVEQPVDPPSAAQIQYASGLGARIPEGVSKQDLSAIIQKKLDGDSEASRDLIDFANHHEIIFSEYSGKQALYDIVFQNLGYIDRMAFYVFCVYRWLSDDRRGNLETHPEKQKFYNWASQVSDNDQVVNSILRYEGHTLRFFGKIILADGNELLGGSTNTIAYKASCEYLQAVFSLSTSKKTLRIKPELETTVYLASDNPTSKKGCFGVLVGVAAFLIVIILTTWLAL